MINFFEGVRLVVRTTTHEKMKRANLSIDAIQQVTWNNPITAPSILFQILIASGVGRNLT